MNSERSGTSMYSVLDHQDLNETLPIPTTENLAAWIYAKLATALIDRRVTVTEIEVQEGHFNRTRLRPQLASGRDTLEP